jgi:hypothetical protein
MACLAYLRTCLPPAPETWPSGWRRRFANLLGLSGTLFSSAKLLILNANVTAGLQRPHGECTVQYLIIPATVAAECLSGYLARFASSNPKVCDNKSFPTTLLVLRKQSSRGLHRAILEDISMEVSKIAPATLIVAGDQDRHDSLEQHPTRGTCAHPRCKNDGTDQLRTLNTNRSTGSAC